MNEGNPSHNRSQNSAHEEVQEGVFTSYFDLRSIIVSQKTLTILLELLKIPAIYDDVYRETQHYLGQCIAATFVFIS